MRIALGSDHRGVHIKARLIQSLTEHSFEILDEGTFGDSSVDYPDFAEAVARRVSLGEADRGILICGTGIGMAITANKFIGVRAAPCYDEVMVEMSRRHNDVNVLCLPGDLIGERSIDDLVLRWLQTEFDGGRHATRLEKIQQIEKENAVSQGLGNGPKTTPDANPPGDSTRSDHAAAGDTTGT